MRVLIAGISTRALAQSAVAAGYEVTSLDFFGDSDQPQEARSFSLVRDFGRPPHLKALAEEVSRLATGMEAVVIESGIENEPDLLTICAQNLIRWFNSPEAIRGVRDLRNLRQVLQGVGVFFPENVYPGEPLPESGRWLLKDPAHSGGMGVREWDGRTALQGEEKLERFIDGQLASACFVADGRDALLLGMTLQYAGISELGASPFAWCGNVAPYKNAALERIVNQMASELTRCFGLAGLNGIDFIFRGEELYILEVNPRPPASVELFERLYGVNAFQLHVGGFQGKLPLDLRGREPDGAWGKGILYAHKTVKIGDTRDWAEIGIADIPHSGEEIATGMPVCTLLERAADVTGCWEKILRKAYLWRARLG